MQVLQNLMKFPGCLCSEWTDRMKLFGGEFGMVLTVPPPKKWKIQNVAKVCVR